MGKNLPDSSAVPDDDILVEERLYVPKKFFVVIHNDDFTPQDYVVYVLQRYFAQSPPDAHVLMLKVHQHGKARIKSYSKDIAEAKVVQVMTDAREHRHPLKLSAEPE